jgi:two-component sensor histidine kinase
VVRLGRDEAAAGGRNDAAADAGRANGPLRLQVVDDGVGLAPGFALEGSSAPRSIGLQIARALCQQLGGELRAGPAEPGPGTCFHAALHRMG